MTHYTLRNFRPTDAETVVDLINLSNQADGIGFRTSVHSFASMLGDGSVDPEHHYFAALSDGQLVGFSTLYRELGTRTILRWWVHPQARDTDVATDLLLRNLRVAHAFPERVLDVPVKPGEKHKLELVAQEDFQWVRTWWRMRLDLPQELPQMAVPAGITTRTFVAGKDEQALTSLVNEVFSEHWGEGVHTLEEIEHEVGLVWFDPDLLVFAESGDRMVGYVWSWVNPETIRLTGKACGVVGDLGVVAECRRRGLGRALLLRALSDLKARGMVVVELDMDGPNVNARRLYESVGFYEKEETRWFRKEPRHE